MIKQDFKGERAIAKGRAWTLEFRVTTGDEVELATNAAAGATSLTVKPLKFALNDGDKLLFGENTVVTVDGNVAAGAVTVTVDALVGPLQAAEVGEKIQDLTGFTEGFEVLADAGDADPVIASGDLTITVPTQTGADRGKVRVTGLAATTSGLAAGMYTYALWRRNSGSERPQAFGDFEIVDRGFL